MKEFLRKSYSFAQLINSKLLSERRLDVILCDCATAASEIAFMLGGQWDGCNGIVLSNPDQEAIKTAANLLGTTWCYQGEKIALLPLLKTDELLRRYALGERNFSNANLRCALLSEQNLSQSNLSNVKLNFANLSGANLSGADLTGVDLSDANLSGANLSDANLHRANLTRANLNEANLVGTNIE